MKLLTMTSSPVKHMVLSMALSAMFLGAPAAFSADAPKVDAAKADATKPNGKLLLDWLDMLTQQRKAKEAFAKYTSENYHHHVMGKVLTRDEATKLMESLYPKMPVIVDDLVKIQVIDEHVFLQTARPNAKGGVSISSRWARIENGKIVEDWYLGDVDRDDIKLQSP